VETREHITWDTLLPRKMKAMAMSRNLETRRSMVVLAAVWQATP